MADHSDSSNNSSNDSKDHLSSGSGNQTKTRLDEAAGSASEDAADILQPRSHSRGQLVWDVVLFQFKLAADGLRDLLLSPLSMISAIVGLVVGGDQPDRYFRQLQRFGRKTEVWINLFGYRKSGNTSDKFVEPLQERVMEGVRENPVLNRLGEEANAALDNVNKIVDGKRKNSD